MATIANLAVKLSADSQGLEKGLGRVGSHLTGLQRGIGQFGHSMTAGLGSLASGLAVAGAGAAALLAPIAGLVGWGAKLAGEMEDLGVSFKVMLGSASAADKMLGNIQKFAAETPFETGELAATSKQLLAFGTSADKVVPTMRVLGDVAAGTGSRIGELAGIFGKVRGTGD